MNEIALTGLVGSHPLGALAAFGLLRCCEELDAFRGAKLSWRQEANWYAVLQTNGPQTTDSLIEDLLSRQRERHLRPELNWSDNAKTEKPRYLNAARESLGCAREFADFLCAFACELSTDVKGRIEPTDFYMTSGRQLFLAEALKLAKCVASGTTRKTPQQLFSEALFGPWKYDDDQHSLGWDPSTERLHAFRAKSPTKDANQGVTAAVWLAFEALPLFPCFFSRGRVATTGFTKIGRPTYLTWPLWKQPITLSTLRSLLSLSELAQPQPKVAELRKRGVDTVFRSQRYKVKMFCLSRIWKIASFGLV